MRSTATSFAFDREDPFPAPGAWSILELADEVAEEKYGEFLITIYDDLPKARATGALLPGPPRWEYSEPWELRPYPLWGVARDVQNVQLTWWSRERRFDARWRRLNALMDALERAKDEPR